MILADTSAWIEYLRQTGSPADQRIHALIESGRKPATSEIVVMELLAGAADVPERDRLRRLLYGLPLLPVGNLYTYELAAELYRRCRVAGETIRKMTDCLVAVVALREGAQLLHHDRDFDAIARHSPLQLAL